MRYLNFSSIYAPCALSMDVLRGWPGRQLHLEQLVPQNGVSGRTFAVAALAKQHKTQVWSCITRNVPSTLVMKKISCVDINHVKSMSQCTRDVQTKKNWPKTNNTKTVDHTFVKLGYSFKVSLFSLVLTLCPFICNCLSQTAKALWRTLFRLLED